MFSDIENHECVLGMDLGGTKIAVAAVDPKGKILMESDITSPAKDSSMMVEYFIDLARVEFEKYRRKGLEVKAVGVSAAGYILQKEGVLLESPNIAWRNVPLRKIASEVTGLPAFLDNDANCAAAGERFVGATRGVDDFVYLTLGTGVGGGVYVDGRLIRGHRGMAAELGHILIDPDGPMCGCGRRGCLEALASGRALGREASVLAREDRKTVLLEMSKGDPDSITGKMVSRAAEQGDDVALRAFKVWSRYLGMGIVDFIHIFDPDVVVLGGGVSESGDLFINDVREVVSERGIPTLVKDVSIVLSELGNKAGVIGAAAIAWEGLGAPTSF